MPPQKIFMPPPVPVDSTMGDAEPVRFTKFSATAWVYGNTVDDPTMRISSRAMVGEAKAKVMAAMERCLNGIACTPNCLSRNARWRLVSFDS